MGWFHSIVPPVVPTDAVPVAADATRSRLAPAKRTETEPISLEIQMTILKSAAVWARARVLWLALAAMPLILAACNNGSSTGGNGY